MNLEKLTRMVNSNAYPSKLLDFIDKKNSQGSNPLLTSHPSKSVVYKEKRTLRLTLDFLIATYKKTM